MLKISVDTYECCLNYVLIRNVSECVRVPRAKILDTLMDLEEKKFLDLLQLENIDRMLNENYTVFLPTDEALDQFREFQYKMVSRHHMHVFMCDTTSNKTCTFRT